MIDVVVLGFIGLAAIFAYLYANSPSSSTISGFVFRLVFLTLALFAAYTVLFTSLTGSEFKSSVTSAWNGTGFELASQCNETITLSSATKGSLTGWLGAYSYVPFLLIGLIIVFYLISMFRNLMKRRKDKELGRGELG